MKIANSKKKKKKEVAAKKEAGGGGGTRNYYFFFLGLRSNFYIFIPRKENRNTCSLACRATPAGSKQRASLKLGLLIV